MITKSYLPKRNAALTVWLNNLNSKLSTHAPSLGLTTAQVTELKGLCTSIIASINEAEEYKTLAKSKVENKSAVMDTKGGALRAIVSRIKTNANYTTTIGKDLGIIAPESEFNANSYKVNFSVTQKGSTLNLKFNKYELDGVHIYMRKANEAAFSFLGRKMKSPFEYEHTLADSLIPERLEFKAIGFIDDEEVGLFSDIAEIVYVG